MNDQDPSIAKNIIKSISKLREDNEFNDFIVTVDGNIISCHSFILASCSEFFRGLLRSNMKEKKEMKVELNNISSPIFQLILKTLYTGCALLTKENMLEVWSAVHQLQIQFLIENCEDFVLANISLDKLNVCKQQAELLQSKRICEYIFNFMCEHFGTFRKTESLLHLNFQDLIDIIKSDKLIITSEDEVLFSIFDWVGYGSLLSTHKVNCDNERQEEQIDTSIVQEEPNDRKQFLIPLLKSTRYCLASDDCIASLYKNELITSDILVKEILFEAFSFHSLDFYNGHWPTAAIQREKSNLEHFGVFWHNWKILAISLKENKVFYIQTLPKQQDAQLTVFKGKLYSCSKDSSPNEVYVLQTNKWVLVTEIPHTVQIFLTHQKYIYVFDSNEKQITRFNPEISPIKLETFKHEIENLAYGLSFNNTIVVFSHVDDNGDEETAVHYWNTSTLVWTKLDNFKFVSRDMTSFRGDKDTYILECNGNLWKLTNSEMPGLTFVAQIWNAKYALRGALLFRETFFLFHESPTGLDGLQKVDGVFSSRNVWKTTGKISPCIHYVTSRKELQPQ